MYSTASPPPKKEGAKSITPSESKGGKPPTVWQRLSVFYQIIPVGATSEQKSGRISCRFLRREAPLRRGYFKSVPQAHRNYSLFTFHYSFFHPKLRKGEKPRHTPSVPGIARESPPARAQAEPGRSSARTVGNDARDLCPRSGSDRKRKAAGFPAAFLLCLLRMPVPSATIQTGVAIRLAVFPPLILKG